MRPRSIRLFEALWFASILVSLIGFGLGLYLASGALADMPGGEELPQGFMTVVLAAGAGIGMLFAIGIPVLLWFLAARQRLEPAKWIILVVVILSTIQSIFGFVMALVVPQPAGLEGQIFVAIIDFLAEGLGIAATVFLFHSDATLWFRGNQRGNPGDIFR
jgi:hypothetical protein